MIIRRSTYRQKGASRYLAEGHHQARGEASITGPARTPLGGYQERTRPGERSSARAVDRRRACGAAREGLGDAVLAESTRRCLQIAAERVPVELVPRSPNQRSGEHPRRYGMRQNRLICTAPLTRHQATADVQIGGYARCWPRGSTTLGDLLADGQTGVRLAEPAGTVLGQYAGPRPGPGSGWRLLPMRQAMTLTFSA